MFLHNSTDYALKNVMNDCTLIINFYFGSIQFLESPDIF